MKNLFSSLFLILLSFNCIAQTAKETVERQFLDYSQLVINKDIDKALDYTNPEIFKTVPREQLKSMMEILFNSDSMEFKFHMPVLSDFEPVLTIDNKNFMRFKNNSVIEMKIKSEPEDDLSEEEQKLMKKIEFNSFESQFGVGNVEYNPETGFYRLKSIKTVIAASDEKMEDWKFVIVDNPRMKELLKTFIPAELLD